jgi:hypothetical protein
MTETPGGPSKPGGFPYMSTNQLMQIRSRLKSSLPKAITNDWLQSVLSISEKAAANLLPQLRRVGLIDKEGLLQQPLVNDFREDDTYADACRRMMVAVYPPALLDAFPEPHTDPAGVASWFRRNANTGERMAEFQARFLALLSSGTPSVQGEPRASRTTPASPGGATPATKKAAAPKKVSPGKIGGDSGGTDAHPRNISAPSIHLDVQIHLDPATDPAQIDAVFASLARHIYGK